MHINSAVPSSVRSLKASFYLTKSSLCELHLKWLLLSFFYEETDKGEFPFHLTLLPYFKLKFEELVRKKVLSPSRITVMSSHWLWFWPMLLGKHSGSGSGKDS